MYIQYRERNLYVHFSLAVACNFRDKENIFLSLLDCAKLFHVYTEQAFADFYFALWKSFLHKYILIITKVFLSINMVPHDCR